MHRSYHRWYSPRLQRDMSLLVHGHAGARAVVFPTSGGRFHEWEDRGMMAALSPYLENGQLQMFSVDTVDRETWYNYRGDPDGRARWHTQYDLYVCDEVLPFTRSVNGNEFCMTLGASFGAYHAVNFALRHPEVVGRTIGLSGIYDITRFTDGYSGGEVYYHNPVAYVPNENDPRRLALLRRMDIVLAIGATDTRLIEGNRRLSGQLWAKGIGNALRVWDGFAHDWPYWQRMLHLYLGGSD